MPWRTDARGVPLVRLLYGRDVARTKSRDAIRKEPVTVNVILVIRAPHSSEGNLPSAVAVRLAEMGGRLSGWRPPIDGAPAKAYFRFESEKECDRFVAGAREIPGVWLEARTLTRDVGFDRVSFQRRTTTPFDVSVVIPNSIVANDLCSLAHVISWHPAMNTKPAEGTFVFDTEVGRKHFLVAALAMRGVRIVDRLAETQSA